jgi:type II secretory pathway component PulC
MLKGLALRQGLFALNGFLAFIFALVLILMVREMLRANPAAGSASAPDLQNVASPMLLGPGHSPAEYDVLMARGLFGEAGKFKRGEKPAEAALPPPADSAQETALPLKLFGTTLSSGDRQLSAAIIEVREGAAKTRTFYPGDEVIDNVVLKEVRRQEVILDNRRANTTESLRISWASSSSGPALAPTRPNVRQAAAAAASGRVNLVSLDRNEITKKLEEEYARVSSTLNVKVVNDESGRPKGITTDNIENFETARELGLKNGDVLVSLNNEPVDSKERAIEVLKKYRNASLFRVGLLRDGQMQYLTYRVK